MSTEDTTAQLREQIRETCGWHATDFRLNPLVSVVLAQVEAAKATARRDALLEAADDIDAADLGPFNQQAQWAANRLRARASAQGVAPPAECPLGGKMCGTPPPASGCEATDCPLVQRSGGQGAQSSGHEFKGGRAWRRFDECTQAMGMDNLDIIRCGRHKDDPIHQRDPGQPGEQDIDEGTT